MYQSTKYVPNLYQCLWNVCKTRIHGLSGGRCRHGRGTKLRGDSLSINTYFKAIRRDLEKCSFLLILFITWPRGHFSASLRSKKLVLTFPYTLQPVSTLSKDSNTLKSLYQILYQIVPNSWILWDLLIQKWNYWYSGPSGRGRGTKLRGDSLSINTKRSRPISGQSDEF